MSSCRPSTTAAFLLAAAGLMLVAPAAAQYRPPAPLPEPVPPAEPTPTAAPAPEEQEAAPLEQTKERRLGWSWQPGLVLDGTYEQNVGFTRPPGPDDIFGALAASLARVRRSERSDFRLSVKGVGYLYRDETSQNRVDAFAALRTRGPLSRRVDGRLAADYSFAHTDSEGTLIESGVLLPLERTKTASASTGLTWRLAERTSLSLDGTCWRVDFESERLLDTPDCSASSSLSRRISPRDDLSLQGRFQWTVDDVSTRRTATFGLGFGHRLGRALRFDVTGGGARTETVVAEAPIEAAPRWNFDGSAAFTGRIRRSTLALSYRHSPTPTYGFGVTQVSDTFGLGATVPIGRSLEVLANGSFVLRSDPTLQGSPRRQDWDAFVGASSRLARRLRLVLGYRFRVRDAVEQTGGKARNDRASVSFVYDEAAR
jgi:hypothetical protein